MAHSRHVKKNRESGGAGGRGEEKEVEEEAKAMNEVDAGRDCATHRLDIGGEYRRSKGGGVMPLLYDTCILLLI